MGIAALFELSSLMERNGTNMEMSQALICIRLPAYTQPHLFLTLGRFMPTNWLLFYHDFVVFLEALVLFYSLLYMIKCI